MCFGTQKKPKKGSRHHKARPNVHTHAHPYGPRPKGPQKSIPHGAAKILGHDALSSHSSHSSHPRKPPTSKYSSRSTTFSHSHGKNTPSAPLAQKRDPTGAPAFYKSKHAPLPPLKTSAFDKRGRAGLDRQAVKDYHNVININYRTAPPPPKTKGDTLYFAKAAPSSSSSAGGGVGGRSGYKHPSHLPPMHNDRYARKPLPSAPPPPFLPRHVAQPKLTPYQLGLQDALPPPSPLKPKKQSRAQMAAFKPLGDIGGYKHGSHCSSGYGGAGGKEWMEGQMRGSLWTGKGKGDGEKGGKELWFGTPF